MEWVPFPARKQPWQEATFPLGNGIMLLINPVASSQPAFSSEKALSPHA